MVSFNKELLKKSENKLQSRTRLFDVLAQLPLTTIESQMDCYHQKVNIQVAL